MSDKEETKDMLAVLRKLCSELETSKPADDLSVQGTVTPDGERLYRFRLRSKEHGTLHMVLDQDDVDVLVASLAKDQKGGDE